MPDKPWYMSKTVWGAIFMLAAIVAKVLGIEVSETDQGQATDLVVAAIEAVVALVGFVLTIVGRISVGKRTLA